jgi:hypothetical protein
VVGEVSNLSNRVTHDLPHHHTSSPETVSALQGYGFTDARKTADFHGDDKINRAIAWAESVKDSTNRGGLIRWALNKVGMEMPPPLPPGRERGTRRF